MSTWTVGSGKTYSTIQGALDALYTAVTTTTFTATQTIEVYDGTYLETATPNTGLNPTATYRLVITAATGNTPIIDGESTRTNGIYINAINYVTVSGLTCKSNVSHGIIFYASSNYGTAYNNICYSNGAGIRCHSSTNGIVYNNTCYSNSTNGIFFYSSTSGTSYGNTCYSNGTNGIYFSKDSDTGIVYSNFCYSNVVGIRFYSNTTSLIYNNLCKGNTSVGIYLNSYSLYASVYNNTSYGDTNSIYFAIGSSQGTVKNNIAWCYSVSGYAIYVGSSTGFVSDNNNFYKTGTAKTGYWVGTDCTTLVDWKTASGQDPHSISADPLFINAGGTTAIDYKVPDSSPCKNKGINLNSIFTTDYFGSLRYTNWDIGFYETSRDEVMLTKSIFSWTETKPAGGVNKQWVACDSDSDGSNLIVSETSGSGGGRIYTSSDSGVNWTERRPVGDVNRYWYTCASDSTGTNLLACCGAYGYPGRIYTSSDGGVNWTERRPVGDVDKIWNIGDSDNDGSNLIVAEVSGVGGGRLYTSSDFGVNWAERRPAGDANKNWVCCASDSTGTNLIAGVYNGGLYTSSNSGIDWTLRVGVAAWICCTTDSDGSVFIAGIGGSYYGRLYISYDSGVNWTETKPAGVADKSWSFCTSNYDGSILCAGEGRGVVEGGRLYTSINGGITWKEQFPLIWGFNENWYCSSSDYTGSNLIVGYINRGRLHIGRRRTIVASKTVGSETLIGIKYL